MIWWMLVSRGIEFSWSVCTRVLEVDRGVGDLGEW